MRKDIWFSLEDDNDRRGNEQALGNLWGYRSPRIE